MFKRNKIEVVAPRDYSNAEVLGFYGGRTNYEKDVNLNLSKSLITSLMALPMFIQLKCASAATGEWAVQTAAPTTIPTGFVADTSLNMLATILDPIIQILVTISFPVASVIMIGACFFFMFGNSEKAWSMILNAGLGYVLIQLSPLFLDILRTVGTAV